MRWWSWRIATQPPTGPAAADLSGTVVLLDLARALGGETLDRSVLLIWTSGQVGLPGATELARSFSNQTLDAVVVLGDLAGAVHRTPEVVAWSSGDTLAPPMLRNTFNSYLGSGAGIKVRETGLLGQFVRLALPFSQTEQSPFLSAGIPSVLLSVSGDMPTPPNEPLAGRSQIANLGGALDHAGAVPSPSSYLTISGKVVPLWLCGCC